MPGMTHLKVKHEISCLIRGILIQSVTSDDYVGRLFWCFARFLLQGTTRQRTDPTAIPLNLIPNRRKIETKSLYNECGCTAFASKQKPNWEKGCSGWQAVQVFWFLLGSRYGLRPNPTPDCNPNPIPSPNPKPERKPEPKRAKTRGKPGCDAFASNQEFLSCGRRFRTTVHLSSQKHPRRSLLHVC